MPALWSLRPGAVLGDRPGAAKQGPGSRVPQKCEAQAPLLCAVLRNGSGIIFLRPPSPAQVTSKPIHLAANVLSLFLSGSYFVLFPVFLISHRHNVRRRQAAPLVQGEIPRPRP